jgi:Tfp pilus assembly protein PilF
MLAALYNNIGWTLHERGEYDRALELFEKAVPLREPERLERLRQPGG